MPKKVIPGASGLSPFLLLKDPFYWGVSSVPLGLGVKLSDGVTASARILLPSVPFLGKAGVGDC